MYIFSDSGYPVNSYDSGTSDLSIDSNISDDICPCESECTNFSDRELNSNSSGDESETIDFRPGKVGKSLR